MPEPYYHSVLAGPFGLFLSLREREGGERGGAGARVREGEPEQKRGMEGERDRGREREFGFDVNIVHCII